MLLNEYWVVEEIKKKTFLETNKNQNIMYQNMWDPSQEVLRGRLVTVIGYKAKHGKVSNKQSKNVSQRPI